VKTARTLLVAALVVATLAAFASVLYVWNATPRVAAISPAQAADPSRPYVVKLHAQWCPVCMLTKSVWSQIETTYSARANLVVFDFTNQATTTASRREAERLGLGKIFDEAGSTGTILILDGRTREQTAAIQGSRDFAEYRAAIDAALER